MASLVASLVTELTVDLKTWRAQMGQAAEISNTRLREIQRSADQSMRSMQNVGRGIRTALGAIGVGLSLGATVMYLKNAAAAAIQFGDDIAKASAKTGVAAGVFSELAYAAKQSDIPIEALGVAFRKMQVAVSQAGSGAKAAQ